jgi:CubicO group peptidase (beta-lactamase class C family)
MRAKNDLFECQRVAIVLAALLLVGSSRPAFADEVDAYLRSEMAKRHIPGLSVAVVRDARTVTIRNYGLSNIELGVPVTSESVFKLASGTKPFTATAVMMLVEEGKISLDEPIARYVPELPSHWRAATVRQLLSHTSGIADYLRAPRWSWQSSWRLNLTPREVVQFASESPLDFAPGTQIRYSNTGYYLLGLLIERVSGKPYAQFLRERIFQPLQMTSTRRDTATEIVPHRVSGYVFENGTQQNAEYTSETWAYSEGGIISTTQDLAKWEAAISTGKHLKPSSLGQMWTASRLNSGKPAVIGDNGAGKPNYYGLGWYISEHRGHSVVFHPGDKPGFSSTITRFEGDHLTVIILCNTSTESPVFPLSLGVADFYLRSPGRVPK